MIPWDGAVDFTGSEFLDRIRESIGRTHFWFQFGKGGTDQADLFLPGESLLSDLIAADKIAFLIFLNYILWCMEGKVRSNKSEVMKEGLACVIFLMICQAFNRMVSGGGGGIVIFGCLIWIEWNVIEEVALGGKEISLIIYPPGLKETIG